MRVMAMVTAKHFFSDNQEFLFERSINRHIQKKGVAGPQEGRTNGCALKQEQLWSRGGKKPVMAELVEELRAQDREALEANNITDVQLHSKLDRSESNTNE